MKKILTVSLVAIMAVSAARADIASVKYVDDSIKPVSESVATKAAAADLQALTTTVNDMDAAYKLADQTINTELAKKANTAEVAATYATKQEVTDLDVTALTGRVEANEGAITALQGADTALGNRLTTAEGDIADINNATTGIAAVAAQNLQSAKDELQGKIDLKADTATVNAALAEKAATSEVTTLAGRVGANETAITALQGADTTINEELAKKADTTYVNEELGKKQNSLPAKPDYCEGKECALVMDKTNGDLMWQVVVYTTADITHKDN